MDKIDGTFPTPSFQEKSAPLLIQRTALLSPTEPSGLVLDQDILIVDRHIRAIGPTGTLTPESGENITIIAAQGQMAIPGLINAHTHSTDNLMKAASPSLPLELWLIPVSLVVEEWTPRMVYLSALLGAVEMLKGGTTAVLDHLWFPDGNIAPYMNAAMQAYADAGIRAAVAPYIEDQDLVQDAAIAHGLTFPAHPMVDRFASFPTIDAQFEALERFFATWHKAANGRLRCLVGPSGVHWCSQNVLQRCLLLAESYQTGIHLHAVETALQASVIRSALGQGGIASLETLGLLRTGTSLAHAIWLEEDDLERLARSGATVVHNPVSNLRLGSGRFPFTAARRQGVSIALGSDGASCNDNQNMFGVLKLTGLMHNVPDNDHQQWPGATEILDAATQGGAAALNMPGELGRIAPGQLADIVLLDLKSPAFIPLHDPYLHLIYSENGNSVKTVIVDGKVIVEHGKVISIDEDALQQEMLERYSTTWPGFAGQWDRVAHTSEVMATFDALRRLLLNRENA